MSEATLTAIVHKVPLGGDDESYRIARQVRYDIPRMHTYVHKVVAASFGREVGHLYRARCGEVLSASAGAILTTREADCGRCVAPKRWVDRG